MISIITALFLLPLATTIIINDSPGRISQLSKCTVDIFRQYNANEFLLMYIELEDLPVNILSSGFPVMILNLKQSFKLSKYLKVDFYLSILNNPEELNTIIDKISRKFQPSTKYVVVYKGEVTEKAVDKIFSIALSYRIINIVVVVESLSIYSYFPFKNGACGNNTDVVLMGGCFGSDDLFPDKLPLYFEGCQIRILALNIAPHIINVTTDTNPGLEVTLLRLITERMQINRRWIKNNFTSHGYRRKTELTTDEDGGYSGMFLVMWYSDADLMLGMLRMNNSYTGDFEFTQPHSIDSLSWNAPVAGEVKKWKNILLIFTLTVWAFLGIVIPLNAVTWVILARNFDNYRSLKLCLLVTLYALLQGSVRKPVSNPLRFAFISWVMATLLISTAYQSQLISLLTKTIYEDQIETPEEFIAKGLEFGFYDSVRDLFDNPSDPTDRTIYNEYKLCPLNALDCINRTAFKRDFVVLKNRRQISYHTRNYILPDGRNRVYSFEKDVLYYPLAMVMQKGHPFLPRINSLVNRMPEYGFTFKIEQDTGLDRKYKNFDKKEAKPLILEHLMGSFIVYAFGNIISSIVLFLEVFINKICRKISRIFVVQPVTRKHVGYNF